MPEVICGKRIDDGLFVPTDDGQASLRRLTAALQIEERDHSGYEEQDRGNDQMLFFHKVTIFEQITGFRRLTRLTARIPHKDPLAAETNTYKSRTIPRSL